MFRRCSLRFSIAAEGLHILELRQQLRQLYVKGEANVNPVYLVNHKYKLILALSNAGRGQDICEALHIADDVWSTIEHKGRGGGTSSLPPTSITGMRIAVSRLCIQATGKLALEETTATFPVDASDTNPLKDVLQLDVKDKQQDDDGGSIKEDTNDDNLNKEKTVTVTIKKAAMTSKWMTRHKSSFQAFWRPETHQERPSPLVNNKEGQDEKGLNGNKDLGGGKQRTDINYASLASRHGRMSSLLGDDDIHTDKDDEASDYIRRESPSHVHSDDNHHKATNNNNNSIYRVASDAEEGSDEWKRKLEEENQKFEDMYAKSSHTSDHHMHQMRQFSVRDCEMLRRRQGLAKEPGPRWT